MNLDAFCSRASRAGHVFEVSHVMDVARRLEKLTRAFAGREPARIRTFFRLTTPNHCPW
jgi:hypothetical protein